MYELPHSYSAALVVNNGFELSLKCEGETKEIALTRLEKAVEKAVEKAKELFGEL